MTQGGAKGREGVSCDTGEELAGKWVSYDTGREGVSYDTGEELKEVPYDREELKGGRRCHMTQGES